MVMCDRKKGAHYSAKQYFSSKLLLMEYILDDRKKPKTVLRNNIIFTYYGKSLPYV